ncbi:MAG: hypothetical protein K8R18_15210 [Parvibaculum sp.]|uniref:hypothetical protein n=1 Tax=Parvibaculum sp. TaxID=2024848 RepID=UPI0025E68D63|nr:hypothetical protein [Parvibaculum sp.]MCE9650967.1 hypothetical protein [Parvibaculum sp.]
MADERQDELGKVFSFETVAPVEADGRSREEDHKPDEPFTIPAFLRRTAKKTEQPQVTPVWHDDDFARIAATAETPKRDEASANSAQAESADADARTAETVPAPETAKAETSDITASVAPVESTPPAAIDESEMPFSSMDEETVVATVAERPPSEIFSLDANADPVPTEAPSLSAFENSSDEREDSSEERSGEKTSPAAMLPEEPRLPEEPQLTGSRPLPEEPRPLEEPLLFGRRFVPEPPRMAERQTFRSLKASRSEPEKMETEPKFERVEPRFGPVGASEAPVQRRSPWQGKDFSVQTEMDDARRWRLGPALDAVEIEAFSDDPHNTAWMREDRPHRLRWVLLAFIVAAGGYATAHQLDNPETVAALLPSMQDESGAFGLSSGVSAKSAPPAEASLASAPPATPSASTPTIVPAVPAAKPAAIVDRVPPARQDKVAQADEPTRRAEERDDRDRKAVPVTLAPGPHPLSAGSAAQPYSRMRFVKGPDPITPP